MRRRRILVGAACVAVATGVAVMLVSVFSADSKAAPTRSEYLAQVAAICGAYGPKLDRIRPPDVAEPASVMFAIARVLPLLEAQVNEVRALRQPDDLRPRLARWFRFHDRRLAMLEKANRAARRQDFRTMSVAYVDFLLAAPAAAELSKAIGIPHPPC